MSAVYGSPGATKDKQKVWKRFHHHLSSIYERFGEMSSLVLGDMNHKLDSLEDELICQNETSLKKIITDFGLCDFFLCYEETLDGR